MGVLQPLRAALRALGHASDELLGDEERARQILLAASIGMVVGLPFAMFNLARPALQSVGYTELFSIVFLVLPAMLLARRKRALELAEQLVLLAGLFIFGALIVFRGVEGTGLFWGFVFPFLAFFLKGQRRGWWYSGGFLCLVTVYFVLLQPYLNVGYRYSANYGLHYAITLASFTIIAAGFNLLRTRFEEKLQERVTERTAAAKSYLDQLQFQATHDVLTGLPNRVALPSLLSEQIAGANGVQCGVTVCNLSVQRLHELGNILGPEGADRLILEISQRLGIVVQGRGLLARTRRDEFVMIYRLSQLTLDASTLQQFIEQRQLSIEVQGYRLRVEFVMGVSAYPQHAADPAVLLQQAEQAMLQARKSDTPWALYDARQEEVFQRHHLLFGRMCDALDHESFALFLQPQIDLANGQLLGAEALTRWPDPVQGSVPPSEFIPIAEESGLIGPLTEWLLQRCFSEAARWKAAGLSLHLSINLSAMTLLDPSLLERLRQLLAQHRVAAEAINLEITESCFISSPERSLEVLRQLRAMGFMLSIDDFGTGFSSLSYLKDMPLTELKIDQAFVRRLLSHPGDQAIVSSTISLAHNLGLTVVAEGIEDEPTAQWLAEHQCNIAQGYWFARPMPCDAFFDTAMRLHQNPDLKLPLEATA